jgi:Niemann-Pick C1 protein
MRQRKSFVFSLYLLLVVLSLFVNQVRSDCIWYGQCGPSGQGDNGVYNCKYNGPPKPQTNETFLSTFKELCPHLYNETHPTETCCDYAQLSRFKQQLSVPKQLMSRCPACYLNFRTFLCDFTCNPHQQDFMIVTQEQDYTPKQQEVVSLTYYITNSSVDQLYQSCVDVQFSASNQKIMDLLCGTTVDDCSPYKFVNFLGNNPQTPFIFNMNLTDLNEFQFNSTVKVKPQNSTMYKCSEAFSTHYQNASACGCSDCELSCPVPIPPPQKSKCKIWDIDCFAFASTLFFILLSTAFLMAVFLGKNLIRKDDKDPLLTRTNVKFSFFSRIGGQTELYLGKLFENIGLSCAKHPIKVIVTSVLICVVLTSGFVLYFSVLTDPVELWSPASSETRLNKNYYDTHFRPFYRTTQLIIRPTNNTPFTHSTFTDTQEFSAAFQLDFLQQVLELQNSVSAIKATLNNQTIELEDICFAPLKPDNNKCTIQSVLNYFQNDMDNLNKKLEDPDFGILLADYITHIQTCTQAPTSVNDSLGLSCLGEFGGTIMPFVALGSYPQVLGRNNRTKAQYGNATALIITYVINNHKNVSENEAAEAWEKEVIDFMKRYSNPNMTISFSTERSIQDELNRESKSDISTILLSYMCMFLYITLTLGKYRVFNKNKRVGLSSIFIDMKFTLGLVGVLIVFFSVLSSIGLLSFMGVKATLIIFEVIPFLVLAVGVDNIFILVQNYQRDTRLTGESIEQQIGRIAGRVGPSMLLTSTSESLAFFLGALTSMPAVR